MCKLLACGLQFVPVLFSNPTQMKRLGDQACTNIAVETLLGELERIHTSLLIQGTLLLTAVILALVQKFPLPVCG